MSNFTLEHERLPPLHQAACCSASIEAIRSEARNQMSYAAQQFQLRYERIAFQAAAIAVKLWEDADRLQNTESSHTVALAQNAALCRPAGDAGGAQKELSK